METIKNYLDSMFLALPNTEEVNKMKTELMQMMEDKYYELKAEGKSENEAIGIVIKEFGNIDELVVEMNLKDTFNISEKECNGKIVVLEEAKNFIESMKKVSKQIALGVLLCIISPVTLIYLSGLCEQNKISEKLADSIGLTILLCFVAIAVGLFIYFGTSVSKYDYLKNETFYLERSAIKTVLQMEEEVKNKLILRLIIGIMMCIISTLPLIIFSLSYDDDEMPIIYGVCILLTVVSLGVYQIVSSSIELSSYNILLQKEDYTPKNNQSNIGDAISSFYWCMITIVYLVWSFITMDWQITWIVWPIAGIFFGGISAFFKVGNKNINR